MAKKTPGDENDVRRLSERDAEILDGTRSLVDMADDRRIVQDDGGLR